MKNRQFVYFFAGVLLLAAGCPNTYEVDPDGGTTPDLWPHTTDKNKNFRDGGGDGAEIADVALFNDQGVPDLMQPDQCIIPLTCQVSFSISDSTYTSCELMGTPSPLSWTSGSGAKMTKSGSTWSVTVNLSQGVSYQYKYRCVDSSGKESWFHDTSKPTISDGYGGYNNTVSASCNPCGDGGVTPTADSGVKGDSGTTPGSFNWRDGIMYFVMLDRFNDGDTSNNPAAITDKMADWNGGDLKGLLAKLKANYFKDLGVNVLWISCPIDAPAGKWIGIDDPKYYTGYHGYWPTELTTVEKNLGTAADLTAVITEAHSQGIKVVMDYVMNHVHSDSSTYKNNSSWFYPLYQGSTKCVCGQGCSWNLPQGLYCWFTDYLPDFNFSNATARAFSVNNAAWWATTYSIDGFRLDAVKHIDKQWIVDLRAKMKTKSNPYFYMVGETYTGDKATIKDYISTTMLDGQFDFPLRAEMVKSLLLRTSSFSNLDAFLTANETYYGSNAIMGTFIGNHDLPRSIHYGESSPPFSNEWDGGKSKAWSGQPSQPTTGQPYELLAVAFTALLTLPGVPLIYYGDEIGLAGAGDPDNRRMMPWSGYNTYQQTLKAHVAKAAKTRAKYPALSRGTRKECWKSQNVYCYTMTLGSDHLVVLLNTADTTQTITPKLSKTTYTDELSGKSVTSASIAIPARSSMILH